MSEATTDSITGAGHGAARSAGAAPAGRILAVASGKGGVGKTWFSVTLATALARRGRRVLVFDGDLGLANVDVQIGMVAKRHLGTVLAGTVTLQGAVTPYPAGGFDVVAGSSGSGSLASLSLPQLIEIARALRETAAGYDDTIIDISAGLDRTVRRLSQLAGTCLVVTTGEPTAITDAYAFIKLCHADRAGSDMRIVVNMAETRAEGERTYGALLKACRSFLGIEPPLAGIVRRDRKVPDAIRHQTPLLVRHPGAEAAADVEAVAELLTAPR